MDIFTKELINRLRNIDGSLKTNSINISSVCNGSCFFCSNKWNPFEIHKGLFCSLDYVYKALDFIDDRFELRLSDTLPGRLSEGEVFLHPQFFEILNLIRERFPYIIIDITTNGTLLTKDFIDKLKIYKPLHIRISYHSNNPSNWSKLLGLDEDKYYIVKNAIDQLVNEEISIGFNIVTMPNLVGYEDIDKTMGYLSQYPSNSFQLWFPGHTKYTPVKIVEKMLYDKNEMKSFVQKMTKKHKLMFLFSPSLRPLNFTPITIINNIRWLYKNVYWLFSEEAFKDNSLLLTKLNKYEPLTVNNSIMVKNESYGGNITVSGLLMVEDFKRVMKKILLEKNVDCFILPRNAFDSMNNDISGTSNYELKQFDIPIIYG
jgi:uncharacterized Fe-S cluster-containing radical SAM superfamily protein